MVKQNGVYITLDPKAEDMTTLTAAETTSD